MRALRLIQAARWQTYLVLVWMLPSHHLFAQAPVPHIISIEPASGAEVHRRGTDPLTWDLATTDTNNNHNALNPGDRLRVIDKGRAAVLWTDNTVYRLERGSELEVPEASEQGLVARLRKGLAYFFHRDKPGTVRVETSKVSLTVRGTEFTVEVLEDDTTKVGVIDGELLMSNAVTSLVVLKGQGGTAQVDGTLQPSAAINATNLVQWCLYYPGIVYLGDLRLSPQEEQVLSNSLTAYRAGDLHGALAQYPPGRLPGSDDERLFLAALWLSIGQVEECVSRLGQMPTRSESNERIERVGEALRQLIAAVKHERRERALAPILPSEWLAESYYQQSRAGDTYQEAMKDWEEEYYGKRFYKDRALRNALKAAQLACSNAPDWDFAWVRRAELEFSFGDTKAARKSLDKVMRPSLLNAHAFVLDGFLAAAQDRWKEAEERFNQAIGLDGGLANGWLGRGLTRIRQGRVDEGRKDLEIAASMEPLRSLPRSYLGKGYYEEAFSAANPYATVKELFGSKQRQRDLVAHATNELALAQQLDTKDPTPLLYSALIDQQENRINEAIGNLEKSIQLNDNRAVYRSRLLLDEDLAVRSSSLASAYQDAGMNEVSVREAAKAVSYDYGNYSAHLFLSESYDALRDPTRYNLRYETPWFNELLLANLLSPVGGTPLSQNISQQEYARLFERDRIGLTSDSEYRSDGKFHELASQYGTVNKFGWALDLDYHYQPDIGERDRPNNGLNDIEWYTQLKYQLTPHSSVFLLTKYQDYHSGDNFQYYDPSAVRTNLANYGIPNAPVVRTNFTFDETQKPIVIGGYHYEWAPGIHTLALAGRLSDNQVLSDSLAQEYLFVGGNYPAASLPPFDVNYSNEFEAWTTELEQIFQSERQLLEVGARFQSGRINATDQLIVDPRSGFTPQFNAPAAATNISEHFRRESVYGYYTLYPVRTLALTAGVAYDVVQFPENFRSPPIAAGTETKYQLGPKAAIVYAPAAWISLRGAYSRSLAGVTLDQSVRLERTELAGFIQTFRSVMPESVVGSLSAPSYETYNAALDFKVKPATYISLDAGMISSDVDQQIGVFYSSNTAPVAKPGLTLQHLGFKEPSAGIVINQLVSTEWSIGFAYRFTSSELHSRLTEVALDFYPQGDSKQRSDLHRFSTFLLFNHPSGFFAGAEANYFYQENSISTFAGGSTAIPPTPVTSIFSTSSSEFPQFNVFAGWRFPRQRGDITFGVLNLGGGDYHLNPLNSYPELPRERLFTIRLRFRL